MNNFLRDNGGLLLFGVGLIVIVICMKMQGYHLCIASGMTKAYCVWNAWWAR